MAGGAGAGKIFEVRGVMVEKCAIGNITCGPEGGNKGGGVVRLNSLEGGME